MTLRHMQIFLEVADCRKMSSAADRLFISQPSISQSIAQIEAEYGIKLFERLNKKLYLTPQGEQLLDYVRHIVALYEEMELKMKHQSTHHLLRIGATITVGNSLITGLISQFQSVFAQADCRVVISNTSQISEKILKNELDLGMVEGKVTHPQLREEIICTDELVVICPVDHPLLARQPITLLELSEQPLLLREVGSGTRAQLQERMEQYGYPLSARWSSSDPQVIKQAVMAGLGISVLSRRLVQEELRQKKLATLSLQAAPFLRSFRFLYHKNKYISPIIEQFFSFALAYCNADHPSHESK